jgi:hypothetical protein
MPAARRPLLWAASLAVLAGAAASGCRVPIGRRIPAGGLHGLHQTPAEAVATAEGIPVGPGAPSAPIDDVFPVFPTSPASRPPAGTHDGALYPSADGSPVPVPAGRIPPAGWTPSPPIAAVPVNPPSVPTAVDPGSELPRFDSLPPAEPSPPPERPRPVDVPTVEAAPATDAPFAPGPPERYVPPGGARAADPSADLPPPPPPSPDPTLGGASPVDAAPVRALRAVGVLWCAAGGSPAAAPAGHHPRAVRHRLPRWGP